MVSMEKFAALLLFSYLEVSYNHESCSTEPSSKQTLDVQHAVAVLMDELSITQQTNHNHCNTQNRTTTVIVTNEQNNHCNT